MTEDGYSVAQDFVRPPVFSKKHPSLRCSSFHYDSADQTPPVAITMPQPNHKKTPNAEIRTVRHDGFALQQKVIEVIHNSEI